MEAHSRQLKVCLVTTKLPCTPKREGAFFIISSRHNVGSWQTILQLHSPSLATYSTYCIVCLLGGNQPRISSRYGLKFLYKCTITTHVKVCSFMYTAEVVTHRIILVCGILLDQTMPHCYCLLCIQTPNSKPIS